MKTKKHQAGFTLVELMVVIAVIAILASIGVPKMSQYIKKAKVNEVSQQAKWVIDAMKEYESSHEMTPLAAGKALNTGGANIKFAANNTADQSSTLRKVVPTLGIIENGRFNYYISFGTEGGAGEETISFCMAAKFVKDDGAEDTQNIVLYSSTPVKQADDTTQWEMNINAYAFMTEDGTAPQKGGACTANGTHINPSN